MTTTLVCGVFYILKIPLHAQNIVCTVHTYCRHVCALFLSHSFGKTINSRQIRCTPKRKKRETKTSEQPSERQRSTAVNCCVCRCFEYGRNISKVVGCVIGFARLHICMLLLLFLLLHLLTPAICTTNQKQKQIRVNTDIQMLHNIHKRPCITKQLVTREFLTKCFTIFKLILYYYI